MISHENHSSSASCNITLGRWGKACMFHEKLWVPDSESVPSTLKTSATRIKEVKGCFNMAHSHAATQLCRPKPRGTVEPSVLAMSVNPPTPQEEAWNLGDSGVYGPYCFMFQMRMRGKNDAYDCIWGEHFAAVKSIILKPLYARPAGSLKRGKPQEIWSQDTCQLSQAGWGLYIPSNSYISYSIPPQNLMDSVDSVGSHFGLQLRRRIYFWSQRLKTAPQVSLESSARLHENASKSVNHPYVCWISFTHVVILWRFLLPHPIIISCRVKVPHIHSYAYCLRNQKHTVCTQTCQILRWLGFCSSQQMVLTYTKMILCQTRMGRNWCLQWLTLQ